MYPDGFKRRPVWRGSKFGRISKAMLGFTETFEFFLEGTGGVAISLWLCQNSYWKWQFLVSFPVKNGDFP